MRILGIDPGLRLTGYGCIDVRAPSVESAARLVEAGVFRMSLEANTSLDLTSSAHAERLSGSAVMKKRRMNAASVSARLVELDEDFREALDRLKPDFVAVESLFAHYKHPATAIVMGHARGVLLLAIRAAKVKLLEYKPNEVKKSLTGNGHAPKEQMQRAVQLRFGLADVPRPPDVADALAIALCAAGRVA